MYICFVSFLNAPSANDAFVNTWRKLVPIVHAVVNFVVFFAIPVVVVFTCCWQATLIRSSVFENQLLLYPICQGVLLLWWIPFDIKEHMQRGLAQFRTIREIQKKKEVSGATNWQDLLNDPTYGPLAQEDIRQMKTTLLNEEWRKFKLNLTKTQEAEVVDEDAGEVKLLQTPLIGSRNRGVLGIMNSLRGYMKRRLEFRQKLSQETEQ